MVIDVLCTAMAIWAVKVVLEVLRRPKRKPTGKEKIRAATYSPKQFRRKRDEW
jgi:hypothetical protein